MRFIKESLLDPGRRFTITDQIKDSNVGPGSVGWMSQIVGGFDNWQNVAKIISIVTRKGKSGKPRIERFELLVPVFYHFNNSEAFAKIMPDPSHIRYYVMIEPEGPAEENVLEIPTLDFIGWATATIQGIRNLVGKTRYATWPEDQAHPMNRMLRMHEMFNEDPQRFLDQYDKIQERENLIGFIRKMESAMFKLKMGQTAKKADIVLNSAEFLVYVNKGEFIDPNAEDKTNEFRFADDDALLVENFEYHKKIKEDLYKLCKEKKI